jgi:hypothetical protein
LIPAFLVLAACAPQDYEAETTENACIQAKISVEDRLRAPGSAEFSTCDENTAKKQADGYWAVGGYVDAQNAFGAKLRSIYLVMLTHANGRWQTVSVDIEPK